MKKKICDTFKKHGLKITIEANKKVVTFLDVELDLDRGMHSPYIKPNDTPLYVHRLSNDPPCVTKNIPEAVNRRLSALSSNEEIFDSVKPVYQQALENSGYDYQLNFTPSNENPTKPRNRKRNILWFNPPYSRDVKTNVGKISPTC